MNASVGGRSPRETPGKVPLALRLAVVGGALHACAAGGASLGAEVVVSGLYTGTHTVTAGRQAGPTGRVLFIECSYAQRADSLDAICGTAGTALLQFGAPGTFRRTGQLRGRTFTGQDLTPTETCVIQGEFSDDGLRFTGRATCPFGSEYRISMSRR